MKFTIVLILSFHSFVSANELGVRPLQKQAAMGISLAYYLTQNSIDTIGKRVRSLISEIIEASQHVGQDYEQRREQAQEELDELSSEEYIAPVNIRSQQIPSLGAGRQKMSVNTPIVPGLRNLMGDTPQKPARKALPGAVRGANCPVALNFDDDEVGFVAAQPAGAPTPESLCHTPVYSAATAFVASGRDCSTPSSDQRRPCLTPVQDVSLRSSIVLETQAKKARARESVHRLVAGVRAIRGAGLEPLMLNHELHGPELAEPHPFVSDSNGVRTLREWRESNTQASFPEFAPALPCVSYLSEVDREECRVEIRDNVLFKNGVPLRSFSGIFVIGPDLRVYVGKDIIGQFHHSSFFTGGAVIWAGELFTDDAGRLFRILNDSGHYRPQTVHNVGGLRVLQSLGVNLSTVVFNEYHHDKFEGVDHPALEYLGD